MKGQVAAGAALAAVALTGAPSAQTSPLRETVTVIENQLIPNLPGKRLVANIVEYPPGAKSVPHRHAGSAFIYAYVLSGEVRSAVGDEAARVYRAGEGWTEKPGAHHRVSENASSSEPARLLAVFVVDDADSQLTTPDNH
jgi:quercetin dioxygenase-like cupin family protein